MERPPRRSLDTCASGLVADSILSLSAFPDTPTSAAFNPTLFRRPLPTTPPGSSPSSLSSPRIRGQNDWQDSASLRAAPDDNIPGLTTHFITNALGRDYLDNQDARSEITYPPLSPPELDFPSTEKAGKRPPPLRLLPARDTAAHGNSSPNVNAPPSAYIPPESSAKPSQVSSISEESALAHTETHGRIHSDVRTNSITNSLGLGGAKVVGVAPATMVQTIGKRSSHAPGDSATYRRSGHMSTLPSTREHPPLSDIPDNTSHHSVKSFVPSFVSSAAYSLHKALARYGRFGRTPSPQPPLPLPSRPLLSSPSKSQEAYYFNGSVAHVAVLGKNEDSSAFSYSMHGSAMPLWERGQLGPDSPKIRETVRRSRKRLLIALIIFGICAVTGIVAGVVISLKGKATSTKTCADAVAGSDCSMNATCVCTSSSSRCDGLAQNLVDLIPIVNEYFQTNLTQSDVYTAVWNAVGSSKTCVAQANTVDLAPALSKDTSPGRLQFAQAAILWNLVQSMDSGSVQKMRTFVLNAPWVTLSTKDGADSNDAAFASTVSGFTFNFASQKVSAPSVSFVSAAAPSSDQLSRLAPSARDVLDRMYSVARASASQRKSALGSYWTGTLQQDPSDMQTFLSAFIGSPILIPFDAESTDIQGILAHNQSSSFPPPLACSPGLTSSQLSRVNQIESTVFGLSNVSRSDNLDFGCYPSRPTYGRLDILQLRLPFADKDNTTLPRQAVALGRDSASRMVIYPGAANAALPWSDPQTPLSSTQTDYRQYGTTSTAEHVVLAYLKSIGDVNLAMTLVKFLLRDTRAPPGNDIPVDKFPAVEVAIFGTIDRSDLSSVTTSFSTKAGSAFYGSPNADTMRAWATTSDVPILWAENAYSTEIARQTGTSSQQFQDAWKAAQDSLQNNIAVTVKQITDSLHSTGQFTPAYGF